MAQFYDQDNPRASYTTSDNNMSRYERNYNNYERSQQTVDNLVRRSTGTGNVAQRDRARVIKAQQRRQQRQKRIATLLIGCMILGGVTVGVANEVVDTIHENRIVYEQTSAFRRDVIYPNTHRTLNNQYYYYDYDDIADAIMADGKDFSTELYKAYADLGEYQTNRVMKYTDYANLESYVTSNGFKDIDEWADAEKKKIVLQAELDEKKSQLEDMHRELNGDQVMGAVEENYVGRK